MAVQPQVAQAPGRVLSTLNEDGSRRWIRPRPSPGAWWPSAPDSWPGETQFRDARIDEIIDPAITRLVLAEDLGRLAGAVAAALREGRADTEARLVRTSGGEPRHYYLSCSGLSVEGASYVVVSGVDVTARRGAEDEDGLKHL